MTRLRAVEGRLNVLLTGGTGFLGSVVGPHLAEHHDVEEYNRADGRDVLDLDRLLDAARGKDVIVHLAGRTQGPRHEVYEANVHGTLNCVEAAASAGASMVFASSAAAVERVNHYGRSKHVGEAIVAGYAAEESLDVAILRIFNVFGPDAPGVLTRFLEDDPVVIHGDGQVTRDFIHMEDVASAVASCLRPQGLFRSDVGTGTATSLAEVAAWTGKRVVHQERGAEGHIDHSVAKNVCIPGWAPVHAIENWVRERSAPFAMRGRAA